MGKKYSNLDNVISGFFRNHSDDGECGNIFFKDGVIYDYGEHFPLAIRLDGGFYLCNGDKWGKTTGKHQSMVFSEVPNSKRVQIPFSALRRIDDLFSGGRGYGGYGSYDIGKLRQIEIIDYQIDKYIDTGRVSEIDGHALMEHVLGAVVFRYKGKKYLSGMDETGQGNGVYFLTELVEKIPIESVSQALESMKPDGVKLAEQQGIEVKRQGEWFFVKDMYKLQIKLLDSLLETGNGIKDIRLESLNGGTGHHCVTIGIKNPENGVVHVKGIVRHDAKEHKQLKLYDDVNSKSWWRVYENIQVQSFTAIGNVD